MKGWLDNYGKAENANEGTSRGPSPTLGTTKKGFNYNGAWGGPAQSGKKVKPLYVGSEKNPRYKAYQDSLNTFNNYESILREGKEIARKRGDISTEEKLRLRSQYPLTVNPEYRYPLGKGPKIISTPKVDLYRMARYKYPEQSVVVKKPVKEQQRAKLAPISDLTPRDIQSDFNLEATAPVYRPEAKVARYFNIRDEIGGSTTDYQYDPNIHDDLTQLAPTSRRTMTPVYKYGGPIAQSGEIFSNTTQMAMDAVQWASPALRRFPLGIGAIAGLAETGYNKTADKVSDVVGLFPGVGPQLVSLVPLYIENETRRLKEVAAQRNRGKTSEDFAREGKRQVVDKEEIDKTAVAKDRPQYGGKVKLDIKLKPEAEKTTPTYGRTYEDGGWLDQYASGGEVSGEGEPKEKAPVVEKKAEANVNVGRRYGELFHDMDDPDARQALEDRTQKIHLNSQLSCTAGSLNCLTDLVQPALNSPSVRKMTEKNPEKYKIPSADIKGSGTYVPNQSLDAWEIHQQLSGEGQGKNILNPSMKRTYKPGAELPNELDYKNLPIGTILGQGSSVGVYTDPKSGERNRHAVTVIGFDKKDGMPLIYDYGHVRRIDDNKSGVDAGMRFSNVTIPKGYENYTRENLTKMHQDYTKSLGYDEKKKTTVNFNSKKPYIAPIQQGVNEVKDQIGYDFGVPQTAMNKLASLVPGISYVETKIDNNEGDSSLAYTLLENKPGNKIVKPVTKALMNVGTAIGNIGEDEKAKQDYVLEIEAYKKYGKDEKKRNEYLKKLKEEQGGSEGYRETESSVGAFAIKNLPEYATKTLGITKEDISAPATEDQRLKLGSKAALTHLAEDFTKLKKKYPKLTDDQLVDLSVVAYNNQGKVNDPEFINYYIKNKVMKDTYLSNVKGYKARQHGGTIPQAQTGNLIPSKSALKQLMENDEADFPGYKASPENYFTLEDKRKVSQTTGKAIDPNVDLVGGQYSKKVVQEIINAAEKHGIDPYTALSIGLQETKFGKADSNIGHVTGMQDVSPGTNAIDDYVKVLKSKMEYADSLGIKDEATRLQVYNGLGLITPQTENRYHGFDMQKIYGVPIPKEGINMRKNPLYGKRIQDLRENVLQKDEDVMKMVTASGYNPFSGQFEEANPVAFTKERNAPPAARIRPKPKSKQLAFNNTPPVMNALQGRLESGGSMPGSVGFSYARTGAPSNGKYAKKTLPSALSGKIIDDNMGQWAHPGKVTRVNSNNITMKGVPYDVMGVSDAGDKKLMKPGQDYKFRGKRVTEYPVGKNGTELTKLDQLTNFTNYNTKQPGGWLDNL